MLADKHITYINSLYVSRQTHYIQKLLICYQTNTLHSETPYMLADKHITYINSLYVSRQTHYIHKLLIRYQTNTLHSETPLC